MRLIAVCSGKGGDGKSCVCAYTAAAMAALNIKTLLVDMGGPVGSLDTILGAGDSFVFNLSDVLCGECEAEKAVIDVEGYKSLYLLPAGIPPAGKVARNKIPDILAELNGGYEAVFLDNPDFRDLDVGGLSEILLVAGPDTLSARAAAHKNTELIKAGAKSVRLVINNVPPRITPMKSFKNFDELIDIIGARLIAVVPASEKLYHGANNGQPVSRDSLTVKVFESLALRLLGKHRPLLIR